MMYTGCNYKGITVRPQTSFLMPEDMVLVTEETTYLYSVVSRKTMTVEQLIHAVSEHLAEKGHTIPELVE